MTAGQRARSVWRARRRLRPPPQLLQQRAGGGGSAGDSLARLCRRAGSGAGGGGAGGGRTHRLRVRLFRGRVSDGLRAARVAGHALQHRPLPRQRCPAFRGGRGHLRRLPCRQRGCLLQLLRGGGAEEEQLIGQGGGEADAQRLA